MSVKHSGHSGVWLRTAYVAASCLLALSACANKQALNDQLAASRAALEQARLAGAASVAPEDYNMARDKLARAAAATGVQDKVIAMRLAEQAQADAEVAKARAGAVRNTAAAAEIAAANQALREEINRSAKRGE
jgi:hypothetical protein